MTDTDKTNLDLATAEKMLIEAGAVEQAAALKFYTEGIRNMMLGVIAPNFERALEQILVKHVDVLSRRLDNSDQARVKRNAEFQIELDNRLDAHGNALERIEQSLVIRRQAIDERLDNHETRIARLEQHLGLGDGNG